MFRSVSTSHPCPSKFIIFESLTSPKKVNFLFVFFFFGNALISLRTRVPIGLGEIIARRLGALIKIAFAGKSSFQSRTCDNSNHIEIDVTSALKGEAQMRGIAAVA